MNLSWQRFWSALVLGGVLFGFGWPPAYVRVEASMDGPNILLGDMDICGNGTGTGKITGVVTSADDGSPIQGIFVSVISVFGDDFIGSGETTGADMTDADGTYELSGLPGGTYLVRADPTTFNDLNGDDFSYRPEIYDNQLSESSFTPVVVVDGQTTGNINFAMEESAIVLGRVTDLNSGLPLTGTVNLYRATSQFPAVASDIVTVNESGHFTFTEGFIPGDYKLGFVASGSKHEPAFFDNKGAFADADVIEIGSSGIVTVNLALTLVPIVDESGPTGKVTGKVTLAESGDPFDGVTIYAYGAEEGFTKGTATPDENGVYTMTLPPGEYKIRTELGFTSNPLIDQRDYIKVFYPNSPTFDGGEIVTVAANGMVNNVNFALQRGGRITGRVTLAEDGSGVGFASVAARDGSLLSSLNQSVIGVSDASGFYTLPAVANGVYTVTADIYAEGECRYPTKRYQEQVTVNGPGLIPNINLAMTQGAYITGRVTITETGVGIRVTVRALQAGDDETGFGNVDFSAATGFYRAGPLPPGTYQLFFSPSNDSGLGAVYSNGSPDRTGAPFFTVGEGEVVDGVDVALPPRTDNPDDPNRLYMPALKGKGT